MDEFKRLRTRTVVVIVAVLLAIVGVVVWNLKETLNGANSSRSPLFQGIEADLASGKLVGLSEAALVAKFGSPGRNERGDLVFRTGRRQGKPLERNRSYEELIVRVRNGTAVEAGLGRLPSDPGYPQ